VKVLVVGSGAREHALVRALAADAVVGEVVCAPGNAGIAREPATRVVPVEAGSPEALLALAAVEAADFTIVGPELPLARGVADAFADAGRLLFGPTRASAALESSKAFAKAFMARHGIPTARFEVCTDERQALDTVDGRRFGFPVVVKADGLAAGKGVTVAPDRAAAEAAVREAMVTRRFGDAGATVVIEECLTGPEVSFFAVSDGRRCLALPAAQDHKRIFDGDAGPNTGGMGAFGPSPLFDSELEARVMRDIVDPALDGLRGEGREYRGVLYVGLMLTADGPRVIEFNVRFGDPEAQVILPMVESGLAAVLLGAARGDLGDARWRVTSDPHVGVVMASGGYPGSYETGRRIDGLAAAAEVPGVHVAHAGTALQGGRIVTSGGRVLTVVARGASYPQAIARAYDAVGCISFDGSHVRTDIGQKALIAADSRGRA
jgi:phosphoribosylamine--glycine ligase